MLRLFSYKLTHDTGFAPNPFFGILTLATCKPGIRRTKKEGDWIAGFTSQMLCGDPPGEERLIYLMEVGEKMPFARYFFDPRFRSKIPDLQRRECLHKAGDNIYRPLCPDPAGIGDFAQLPNPYHREENKPRDLSGRYALAASRFYYFGREAVSLPEEVRPQIPKGQSAQGSRTHDPARVRRFLDYVLSRYPAGVLGAPHSWPAGDCSWSNKDESHLQPQGI